MEFGLALALEKVEGPAQTIEFLGVVLDSVAEVLSISETRKQELLGLLQAFSKRRAASVKRLQSLQGKLCFAATVLPGARPFLRRIIDMSSGGAKGPRALSAAFRSEVRYWAAHVLSWNGRASWRASRAEPWVFASDASTSGFAYTLERCPTGALSSLTEGFEPGSVRAGLWSLENGDACRQSTSAEIQWGEFFAPLAAVMEWASAGQPALGVCNRQQLGRGGHQQATVTGAEGRGAVACVGGCVDEAQLYLCGGASPGRGQRADGLGVAPGPPLLRRGGADAGRGVGGGGRCGGIAILQRP